MATLSVIIPAYKENQNIRNLVLSILKNAEVQHIIVVDDSPDDLTSDEIVQLHCAQLSYLHRKNKGGRGSAVIDGIQLALKSPTDYFLEMDADFSHPPEEIAALLKLAIKNSTDLLIASRYLPESQIRNWPKTRRFFSFCSNGLARILLGVPVHDYTNGFRLYSRQAAEVIAADCGRLGKGFISLSEILVNIYYRGLIVQEVPTIFTNRVRGESSLSFQEISDALLGLRRIYLLKNELRKAARK